MSPGHTAKWRGGVSAARQRHRENLAQQSGLRQKSRTFAADIPKPSALVAEAPSVEPVSTTVLREQPPLVDPQLCQPCPLTTSAYATTTAPQDERLDPGVQTAVLDTGASHHIVTDPYCIQNPRASSRVFAGFNGSTTAATTEGAVTMYLPGYDGHPGKSWSVDATTMAGIRQNLDSIPMVGS